MTCRVDVTAPDSSVTQAKALLDCAASTSLITERLANKLRLPRQRSHYKISGVAGFNVRPRGTVKIKVAGGRGGGKPIEVEASVLPRATNDLPKVPVFPVTRWKHLSNLELADPDHGVPAGVDILLRGKVFSSKVVLHGRRYSPARAPSAFKTCFGWLLNGEVNSETHQTQSHICGVALTNPKVCPKDCQEIRSAGERRIKTVRCWPARYGRQEARTGEFPIGINQIVRLSNNCTMKHYLMTV